jgi:LemA protein
VRTALIGTLVLVVAGLAAGSKFVSVRNDLAAQREAINKGWAQVDAALRSRADLLPNLVETLQGMDKRETEIFRDIADARTALINRHSPQEKIQANDRLSNALGRLLVATENYPQLRSGKSFLRLQDQIADKENSIAVERRKYNETLEHYNAQIQMFPGNMVASMSGFTRNDAYFPTEPGAQTLPKAQF